MLSTMLLLKVSWDFICFWVKSSDFSDYSNLLRAEFQQSGQFRNCITPKPFKYRGVLITVRKMRKSPMTLLFDSRSNSYPISIRFAFPDCYVWSSQIGRRCQNYSFWHLAGGFKDGHFCWHFISILWGLPCIRANSFHKMVSIPPNQKCKFHSLQQQHACAYSRPLT
jgi:hypothetical protein